MTTLYNPPQTKTQMRIISICINFLKGISMNFKYSAVAIALLSVTQAYANDIQELNTAEVSAKSDNTVIEVSSTSLENKQVNDIKGALNQLAGVTVSNGIRYSQKTYLRGVEEHSANVTIDGVRQDGQMFHHAGNQTIDTSMLKAVKVQLGATSVLSGYGANTGSIAYETKNPEDLLADGQAFGARAGLAADSATEFRQINLSGYGRVSDQFSLLGMLTTNESGDIDTPDADPIVNKHSSLDSFLIKGVYDIDAAQQLIVNLQSVDDGGNRAFSGEKPGQSIIEMEEAYNGYVRNTYSAVYTNNSDNPALDLYINAYFNEKTLERKESITDTRITPKRDYIYETIGLDIRNSSLVNDVLWTYGIETFKSEQTVKTSGLRIDIAEDGSTTESNLAVSNGPQATLLAGYVQAELGFGDFTIIPGLRYDNYELGGLYDSSFNQLSPKISASWQASNDLNLTLGYGSIFKGPGLPEIIMIRETTTQADDVEAETGDHIELNINYDLTDTLGVDSASFYTNLFQFNIDDSYHPTKNTDLSSNRSDLDNMGIEAGARFNHNALSGYINFSYNDAERDYTEYQSDDSYSGTKEVNIGLNMQVTSEILVGWDNIFVDNAELERTTKSRRGEISTSDVLKPGYGVTNLWLAYEPAAVNGLKVNLAVDNLFDKTYQNHKSFGAYFGNLEYNDNEVGRNFKVSVNYQF
jgi:hemoglobin/transferrin/lactoferrin receptor protein